jgi:hypothetical protein
MSKLSQLAQRIRSLPDIESERRRIAIALRVSKNAKEVADRLAIILRQAPYIDELTRGGMVTAVNESISFSVAQAKSLKKLVRRGNFGSEQKISEYLDNLTKKTQSVEKKRDDLWATVQTKVRTIETILQIAEAVNLDGVETLRLAASLYRQSTASPPSSEADRDKVRSAHEGNKVAIANSGLTGNVKTILDGAILANGDPRLLLEEDVQKFFKDHPELWESLKLKLA